MPRRPVANENGVEVAYLTVSQIATALSCDRGMVYQLIEKGELLGVKPFHVNGVIRVPIKSFRDYEERLAETAERRLGRGMEAPAPVTARTKPRIKADHADHRAAVERLRARGIVR